MRTQKYQWAKRHERRGRIAAYIALGFAACVVTAAAVVALVNGANVLEVVVLWSIGACLYAETFVPKLRSAIRRMTTRLTR